MPKSALKTQPVITDISAVKVEYFDDRFYKATLPIGIDESYYKNFPDSYKDIFFDRIEVYMPSFSTIYSNTKHQSWYPQWRGNVGNLQADILSGIAKQKGSNIHKALELAFRGHVIAFLNPKIEDLSEKRLVEIKAQYQKPVYILHSQEEMIQVARWKKLIDTIKPEIISSEQQVHNFFHCYAGTLDQLWHLEAGTYLINGSTVKTKLETGLYVIDYKTGNTMDDEHVLEQLAAYIEAHPEKDKIVGGIGIHLNARSKNGIDGVKLTVKSREELQPYWEKFLNLKKVFFDDLEIQPKKYEIPQYITYDGKAGK